MYDILWLTRQPKRPSTHTGSPTGSLRGLTGPCRSSAIGSQCNNNNNDGGGDDDDNDDDDDYDNAADIPTPIWIFQQYTQTDLSYVCSFSFFLFIISLRLKMFLLGFNSSRWSRFLWCLMSLPQMWEMNIRPILNVLCTQSKLWKSGNNDFNDEVTRYALLFVQIKIK